MKLLNFLSVFAILVGISTGQANVFSSCHTYSSPVVTEALKELNSVYAQSQGAAQLTSVASPTYGWSYIGYHVSVSFPMTTAKSSATVYYALDKKTGHCTYNSVSKPADIYVR